MYKKSFEYGGYHFYPLRKFDKNDGDFFDKTRRLREDHDLGVTNEDASWKKYQYNYEDFYKAAGEKVFDIFICEENGKQYV